MAELETRLSTALIRIVVPNAVSVPITARLLAFRSTALPTASTRTNVSGAEPVLMSAITMQFFMWTESRMIR